jgi:hypothetical protein
MYKQTPKFRKQLNASQLEVLRVLYRYRFASRDLTAQYFNKKDMYRQLRVLEDRGFIGRRYELNYRLAGKPAAYYLKPDGLRELQQVNGPIEANIKNLYRVTQVSEEFINHCLSIFSISLHLRQMESKTKFFTKIDLQKDDYSYFPSPLPDAYIRINDDHYFLHYADSLKPLFAIIKWLKLLKEYCESGIWDDTGTDFPIVVVVLQDSKYAKKLSRFMERNLDDMDVRVILKDEILGGTFPPTQGV